MKVKYASLGELSDHYAPPSVDLYILTAMWKDGKYTLFKCPLCGSRKYVQVRVQKPNGNWYVTEFYQCFFCSLMFTDPVLFTKQDSSAQDCERGPGGAHRR